MISLLCGFIIGILLYIVVIRFIGLLEEAIIGFKYRNIRGFGEEFAFIIDNTIIGEKYIDL